MKIFTSLDEVPSDFGPSAITIGKFDGVHVGHRQMVDRLLGEARAESLVPTVLTFDRNPLSIVAPAACPPSLVSNDQKCELLERLGVETTVMLTFDLAFSHVAAEEFVESVLVNTLHAKVVYVGPYFRFGRGGKGDVALLEEWGRRAGFEVRHFSVVESDGRRVSSTWVRERLGEGDVVGAAALLGRPHVVRGTVVRGAQRGRQLGFPTANLSPSLEGLIPADGVYAAWAVVDGLRYPAAVSIGNNPTFDGVADRQVEAYLLGQDFEPIDLDLYGTSLELHFVRHIRGMVAFDDVPSLVEGITADVEHVRELLRASHGPGQ